MSRMSPNRMFAVATLVATLGLAGCGGGGGHHVEDARPAGAVEVSNGTDVSGSWENLYYFAMAPSGTSAWTGNLLTDVVFPGEFVFAGTVDEDYYDAEADLESHTVMFFDVFARGGSTTRFEVY